MVKQPTELDCVIPEAVTTKIAKAPDGSLIGAVTFHFTKQRTLSFAFLPKDVRHVAKLLTELSETLEGTGHA